MPTSTEVQCPSCGNTIASNAASCSACGNPVPKGNLAPTGTSQRGYGTDTSSFNCENCGAQTVYSAKQMTMECPYCGSQKVIQLPPDKQATTIQPEYVIPFKIAREESGKRFREWVESLWFAPGDLKQRAQADSIRGVYLPFWVYDVATQTYFRGQVGHYYFEEHQVKDAQGNTRTERERKTRWQPGSGWRNGDYRDVLVCASKGVEKGLVREIEPWNMAERQPYTAQFLAGWEAERYGVDSDDAWRQEGKKRVESEEQTACERKLQADYKGDTTQGVTIDVRYSNLRSRHMLLPAFISAYKYEGATFRFMINGQTGEVQGERPWSKLKIALFIGSIILVIAAIVMIASASNHRATPSGQQPPPVQTTTTTTPPG
jgi:DNA-directed RNA polymerase subunit RPC12/RpoP